MPSIEKWIAKYLNTAQNAEIAASSSEIFAAAQADVEAKQRYGSFNKLELYNESALDVRLELDGLTTRRRTIFAKSGFAIAPEEGIFFDTLKVTNLSSTTALAVDLLNINYGRLELEG